MELAIIVLAGIGNFAVTQTVTRYDGPGRIFERARQRTDKAKTSFKELLSCPVCLGWWTGLLFAIGAFHAAALHGVGTFLIAYTAICGISIALNLWGDS